MKHYGLTLNLKNDPSVIEKYKAYHQDAWPEVIDALKTVGITKMNIYLLGCRLFMAMETIDTFEYSARFPTLSRRKSKMQSLGRIDANLSGTSGGSAAGRMVGIYGTCL